MGFRIGICLSAGETTMQFRLMMWMVCTITVIAGLASSGMVSALEVGETTTGCRYTVFANPINSCHRSHQTTFGCPDCANIGNTQKYNEFSGENTWSLGPGDDDVTLRAPNCIREITCTVGNYQHDYECKVTQIPLKPTCRPVSPNSGKYCREYSQTAGVWQVVFSYELVPCPTEVGP